MSFDGLALAAIKDQLNSTLVNGRIDKIHQPEKEEILFHIRQPGQNYKLVISSNAQKARIQLTTISKTNPMTPPIFCMVLRKHLEGGRIVSFNQASLERIIEMHVENYDELGRLSKKILIGEFMGKYSNLILVDPENNTTILDGLKRYSFASSQYREVLPGRPYTSPPKQEKTSPTEILDAEETFKNLIWQQVLKDPSLSIQKLLLDTFLGLSPQTCKEIVIRANLTVEIPLESLGDYDLQKLWQSFSEVTAGLKSAIWHPTLILNKKNKSLAFGPIDLFQFDHQLEINQVIKKHGSMSEMVDGYFANKEASDNLQNAKNNLLGIVKDNLGRLYKKLDIYAKDLKQAKDKRDYKLMGELLTANIYQISRGQKEVEVINYYDPQARGLTIPLNPQLTPSENAQAYYRKYNKAKTTEEMVLKLKEATEREITYLESVQTNISLAANLLEVAEIKEELITESYLKVPIEKGKKVSKERKILSKPWVFTSEDNFEILVGRNNKQNDWLTLKLADPNDTWFHTKNIPGSHVIIRNQGQEVSDNTLLLAASLAAFFSKARDSANVPVDYTVRKNVHKPNGAKPGMVIYEGQKTVYITPDETLIEKYQLET